MTTLNFELKEKNLFILSVFMLTKYESSTILPKMNGIYFLPYLKNLFQLDDLWIAIDSSDVLSHLLR